MARVTQCNRVLDHLYTYGSITQLEAYDKYGILRLGARIHDLRDRGFNIESHTESSRNRYGNKVTYSRYTLRAEKTAI